MSEAAINEMGEDERRPLDVAPATLTLGALLAAERESKEWPIEHVANQLNLAPRQIQALETDNYAALPGMASVRGFVRAYAKLLKIDAAPLVAMIAGEQITSIQPLTPRRSLPPTPFSDSRLMSTGRRRTSSKVLLAAVLVATFAIVAVEVGRMGGWPDLSQSLTFQLKDIAAPSAVVQSAQPAIASSVTAMASVPVSMPAPESVAAPVSAVPVATRREELGITDAVPATPDAEPNVPEQKAEKGLGNAVATGSAANKLAIASKNLLVLTLRQDSWVEVKAGHTALISRLVKAGSTESLDVTEPVALTLGNAAGVDVTFRGNSLDTQAGARNNVVRLSLK